MAVIPPPVDVVIAALNRGDTDAFLSAPSHHSARLTTVVIPANERVKGSIAHGLLTSPRWGEVGSRRAADRSG
ncbi:MAG: hypothetical protein ACWA6X_13020 [Bauldia sp.]